MDRSKDIQDSSPVFDNFDVDLVVKVLENTAFSRSWSSMDDSWHLLAKIIGPFFLFFIPVFYFFQGAKVTDPTVVLSSIYFISVSAFCMFSNFSLLQRCWSPCLRVYQMVFKAVQKSRKPFISPSTAKLEWSDCCRNGGRFWCRRTTGQYLGSQEYFGGCFRRQTHRNRK